MNFLASSPGRPLSSAPPTADNEYMAMFWLWGVRNLFVVLAGAVAFAGYKGVADWSITLVVMLALALVAEAGNRIGRRSLSKQRRKQHATGFPLQSIQYARPSSSRLLPKPKMLSCNSWSMFLPRPPRPRSTNCR